MTAKNDVLKYAKHFHGKDEPPFFYNEYFELEGKTFLPRDDVGLKEKLFAKRWKGVRENCVLHYFVRDKAQCKLMESFASDRALHQRFYAVCSPDFSVDSAHCFSAFNNAAILKNRLCASLWQSEYGERVILTLCWGDESTYDLAFSEDRRGSCRCGFSSRRSRRRDIQKRAHCRRRGDKAAHHMLVWKNTRLCKGNLRRVQNQDSGNANKV